jgi:hypothetical protein
VARRPTSLIVEAHTRDASSHVQAVLTLDRHRLQRDGFMKAAEQDIRPATYSQRHARLRATIVARQRSGTQVRSRRGDSPQNHCGLQITDVGSELGNGAGIVFGSMLIRCIRAVDAVRRADDKTPSGGFMTGEVARFKCHLFNRLRRHCVEAIKRGEWTTDILIYPAVFDFRHGIELYIKHMTILANRLLATGERMDLGHGIVQNWSTLTQLFADLKEPHFDALEIDIVKDILTDFVEIDATGQVFRYPEDNKGQPHLRQISMINVQVLADGMRSSSTCLNPGTADLLLYLRQTISQPGQSRESPCFSRPDEGSPERVPESLKDIH